MSSVKGVEVNEFSRFIDHTLATPWETFISDIEKRLRSIQGLPVSSAGGSSSTRGIVEFMNLEFEVRKVIFHGAQSGSGIPDNLMKLISGLNVNLSECIILIYSSETNGSQIIDPQLRGTILSAFSIAIRSMTDWTYPVFFTLNSLRSPCLDWMGYRPTFLKLSTDQKLTSWSRYESLSLNIKRLSEKHPLFFFDGIRKVYQQRVSALGMITDQRVMEQFVSHITHYYLFDITQWLGNPEKVIGRIKYPLIPNILNRDLDELLRMLLLRKMTFTMETLSGMNVSIDYREGNQHGVIDNESYSTLLPSRQSAQQFHLYPDWKPTELQQPFTEHETMILPWKSHSIRNLLVFLILASFTKKQGDVGYNFENNYTLDEMMNGVQYEEMAEFVSQLSVPTQTAFYNKIPTGNIAAAASIPGHFTQSQPRSTSSNSSSRPMTPSLNPHMLFPISVSEVTSPKTAILNATAGSHNVTGARGRGQSMSSMSSSASLATNNTLNNSHTTSNHNSAGNDQQAIENDRYFQPVLRYLFQTEPSAPLAELFSPNGSGGTLGKHAGPGIFLDVLDLSKGSIQEATKVNVPMTTNQNTDASTLLALPYPADGVHIWLEQFAVIAGLLPTKTTNIIRLWQHCLRELQQHFDLQSPVPAFSHIVGNTQASSVNHLNTKSSSSQDVQQQPSSFTPMDEDEVLAERRAFIAAEKSKPLYARMLWEDVLHRRGIDEDLSVTIPRPPLNSPFIPSYLRSEMGDEMNQKSTSHKNIYSSVLLQQLQMVHFCTVVQGESVYASNPVNNTPGMVKPFNDPPSLLRRIPLTEDMLALQHHLSQKMFHDTSRTFQANPILKFQVVLPNLVSHMQSFKQANPSATVEDFYHWYGLDSAPASLFSTILHDEEHEAKASEAERVAEPAVQEVEGETNEGDSNTPEEETGPSSFSDPSASAYLASLSHPGDVSSNEDTKVACSTENIEETDGNRMKRRLLKQLETIWQTHCTNGDQTPPSSSSNVFSADKEMTKAMAFLERMSVSGLAEELLYLAVCFSWRILQHSASSLPSAAARNLAEKAVKPVQQEILELQRLRERYPSSTHTTIMRRMFLQSLEESSPLAASAASHDPPVHSDVVSPVTPPRDLPVHDSTNVPLDAAPKMLPPLQMPHSPFPQPSALAAVTTLQELVTAYDRLANAMACAEDRIHRLLQLSPVEEHITELFSGENAFLEPLSPFVKSPSPQRTKKVSVTRTTTGDTHVSFNPNDTTNAARWTQMLHLWLPQSRPASAGGGTLKYQLRDEREKLALLQRMKTLTATQTLASATIGGSVAATAGGTASGGTSNTAVAGAATEWHSTDGRELGAPSSKRFVLRALLPTNSPYVEAVERAAEDGSDALDAAPVTLHFDDDEDESQDTVSPSKKSTSLIFDVDEDENPTLTRHNQKDEHDIALTVYCDRENLHAMWEYLEED